MGFCHPFGTNKSCTYISEAVPKLGGLNRHVHIVWIFIDDLIVGPRISE